MKQYSARKNTRFQKTAAVLLSAIYLQVNVAWAASPTLPMAASLHSLFSIFIKPSKKLPEIFVFHSMEEDLRRQQQTQSAWMKPEEMQRPGVMPEAPAAALPISEKPVSRVRSLKPAEGQLPIQTVLKQVLGDTKALGEPEVTPLKNDQIASISSIKTDDPQRNVKLASAVAGIAAGSINPDWKSAPSANDTYTNLVTIAQTTGNTDAIKDRLGDLNDDLKSVGLRVDVVKDNTGRFQLVVQALVTAKDLKNPNSPLLKGLSTEDRKALLGAVSLLSGTRVRVDNYVTISEKVQTAGVRHGLTEGSELIGVSVNRISADLTDIKARYDALPAAEKKVKSFTHFYIGVVAGHESGHALLNENSHLLKNVDPARRTELHEFFAMASELMVTYDKDASVNKSLLIETAKAIFESSDRNPSPEHKGGATLVRAAIVKMIEAKTGTVNATAEQMETYLKGLSSEDVVKFFQDTLKPAVMEHFKGQLFDNPVESVSTEDSKVTAPGIAGGVKVEVGNITPQTIELDADPAKNQQKMKDLFPGVETMGIDLNSMEAQSFKIGDQRNIRLVGKTADGSEPVTVYRFVKDGKTTLQVETTAAGAVKLGANQEDVKKIADTIVAGGGSVAAFILVKQDTVGPVLMARDEKMQIRFVPTDKTAKAMAPSTLSLPHQFNDHTQMGVAKSDPDEEAAKNNPIPTMTPVTTQVTDKNKEAMVKKIGFRGRQFEMQNVAFEKGSKVVRDASGTRLEGKMSWETHFQRDANGPVEVIRFQASNKDGKTLIESQVVAVGKDGTAVFVEYGKNNKAVAATTYHVGDKESRLSSKLTHFTATGGAITRQTFYSSKPLSKKGNPDDELADLQGGQGQYVVREGRLDSTFEMQNDKVVLTSVVENKKSGAIVMAGRDANTGRMFATNEGLKGGMERHFEVLGGPVTDTETGMSRLQINSFHKASDADSRERTFSVKEGGGSGDSPVHSLHLDKDITIVSFGNGQFKKIATSDNAVMAGLMSLSGGKVEQVAAGNRKNVAVVNAGGGKMAQTVDSVKLVDKAGKELPTLGTPLMNVSTNKDKELAQLRKIGVFNTSPIPTMVGSTIDKGEVVIDEGKTIGMSIDYRMSDGATAHLSSKDGQSIMQFDTKTGRPASTDFDMGIAKVTVPHNRSDVAYDLSNGFVYKDNGSYEHLAGVGYEDELGAVKFSANTDTGKITTEVVKLKGQTTSFDGREIDLTGGAAFDKGRVWYGIAQGKDAKSEIFTNQRVLITNDKPLEGVDFTAKAINVQGHGRSLSAEMGLKDTIIIENPSKDAPTSNSLGIATPGASTEDVVVSKSDKGTEITKTSDKSKVAIMITDAGEEDLNGKSILRGQVNIFADGSSNILAGKGGMEAMGMHMEEGMRADVNGDGVLAMTAKKVSTVALADKSKLDFAAGAVGEMDHGRFEATKGEILRTGSTEDIKPHKNLTGKVVKPVQVLYKAGEAPVAKMGKVEWAVEGDFTLSLNDKDAAFAPTLEYKEGRFETNGPGLLDAPKVTEGDGFRLTSPEKIRGPEGADLKVTQRIVDFKKGGEIDVVQEGHVDITITKEKFSQLSPKTGSGWTGKQGAKFSADSYDGVTAPRGIKVESGEVDTFGIKAGFKEKMGKDNSVTMAVEKQEHNRYTADGKKTIEEGVAKFSGNKGATAAIGERTLSFGDDDTTLINTGNDWRLAYGNQFAKASIKGEGLAGVDGTAAGTVTSIEFAMAGDSKQTRTRVQTLTDNKGDRLRIENVENLVAGEDDVVSRQLKFDGTANNTNLHWGALTYKVMEQNGVATFHVNEGSIAAGMGKGEEKTVLMFDGSTTKAHAETKWEGAVAVIDLVGTPDQHFSNGPRVQQIGMRYKQSTESGYLAATDNVFQVNDDGKGSHRMLERFSDHSFRLEKNESFAFLGNTVESVIRRGPVKAEALIETRIAAGSEGKHVMTISTQGLRYGKVVALPASKLNMNVSHMWSSDSSLDLGSGEKHLVILNLDDDGNRVYQMTSSYRGENKFIVEAGSEFASKPDGSSFGIRKTAKGDLMISLFADKSKGDVIWIGGNKAGSDKNSEKVDAFAPKPDKEGRSSGIAGDSEWVEIKREGDNSPTRLGVVSGRVFLKQDEKTNVFRPSLKAGSIVIDGAVAENDTQRLRVVGEKGDLSWALQSSVVYDGSNKEKVALDVLGRAKNMKFAEGAFGKEKQTDYATQKGKKAKSDTGLYFVIIDKSGRSIGASFLVNQAKNETKYWGLSNTDTKSLDASKENGHVEFRELVSDKDGVQTYKVYRQSDKSIQHGTSKVFDLKGQKVIVKRMENGDIETETVDGRMTVTRLGESEFDTKTFEADFSFETKDADGKAKTARVDLAQVRNRAMQIGSGAQRKQAKETQAAIFDQMDRLAATGDAGLGVTADKTIIALAGQQAAGYVEYNKISADDAAFGLSGFAQTVIGLPAGWVDAIGQWTGLYQSTFFMDGVNATGGFLATAEMEGIEEDIKQIRMSSTADLSGTISNLYEKNADAASYFSWRGLDKLTGSLMGFERIMNLDIHRDGWWVAPKLVVCSAEQALNFVPAVLYAKGIYHLIKGSIATVKVVQIGVAVERVSLAMRIANKIGASSIAIWASKLPGSTSIGKAFRVLSDRRAQQIALAAETWGRASNFEKTKMVGGQIFHWAMRRSAINATDQAIHTIQLYFTPGGTNSNGERVTGWDVGGAVFNAAWATFTSEIIWMGPMLGKLVGQNKAAQGILNFAGYGSQASQTFIRQARTWAFAGAALNAGRYTYESYFMGKGPFNGWACANAAIQGAFIGALSYGFMRGVGYVTTKVPGMAAGADKLQELNKFMGPLSGSQRTAKYWLEFGAEALTHGQNAVTGSFAFVLYHIIKGDVRTMNDVGTYSLQGGFTGALVGGAFKAASGWGTQFENMGRVGGQLEANAERFSTGYLHMAPWEITIGNALRAMAPSWFASEHDDQMSELGVALTEIMPESAARAIDKAATTGWGVGTLHFLFVTGRIGKNLATDGSSALSGRLFEKGHQAYLNGQIDKAIAYNFAASAINNFYTMPTVIKMFGVMQEKTPEAAVALGILAPAKGKKLDGTPDFGSRENEFGHSVFGFLGFINTPIHASVSGQDKYVADQIAKARPRLSDFFLSKVPGLGDRVTARRQEGLTFLADFVNGGQGKFDVGSRSFELSEAGKSQAQHAVRELFAHDPSFQADAIRAGKTSGESGERHFGRIGPNGFESVDPSKLRSTKPANKAPIELAAATEEGVAKALQAHIVKDDNGSVGFRIAPENKTNVDAPAVEVKVGNDGRVKVEGDKQQIRELAKGNYTLKVGDQSLRLSQLLSDAKSSLYKLDTKIFDGIKQQADALIKASEIKIDMDSLIRYQTSEGKTSDVREAEATLKDSKATPKEKAAAQKVIRDEARKNDAGRTALGLSETDRLIEIPEDVRAAAQEAYVAKAGKSELRKIAENKDGTYDRAAQANAIGRLHGKEGGLVSQLWLGLQSAGLSVNDLKDLASNGVVRTGEQGRFRVVLGGSNEAIFFTEGENGSIRIAGGKNLFSAMMGEKNDGIKAVINKMSIQGSQAALVITEKGNALLELRTQARTSNEADRAGTKMYAFVTEIERVDMAGKSKTQVEFTGDRTSVTRYASALGVKGTAEGDFIAAAAKHGEIKLTFDVESIEVAEAAVKVENENRTTQSERAPPARIRFTHQSANEAPVSLRITDVEVAGKKLNRALEAHRYDAAELKELEVSAPAEALNPIHEETLPSGVEATETTAGNKSSGFKSVLDWFANWDSYSSKINVNRGGRLNANPIGLIAEGVVRAVGYGVLVLPALALGYKPSTHATSARRTTGASHAEANSNAPKTEREHLLASSDYRQAASRYLESRMEARRQNPFQDPGESSRVRNLGQRAKAEKERVLSETPQGRLARTIHDNFGLLRDPFGNRLRAVADANVGDIVYAPRAFGMGRGEAIEVTAEMKGAARSVVGAQRGRAADIRNAIAFDKSVNESAGTLEQDFQYIGTDAHIASLDAYRRTSRVDADAVTVAEAIAGERKVVNDAGVEETQTFATFNPGFTGSEHLWNGNYGLGRLTLNEYGKVLDNYSKKNSFDQGRMRKDIAATVELGAKLSEIAPDFQRKQGKAESEIKTFKWTPGQLFSNIMSAEYNINMEAGGGKTIVQQIRALTEAMDTSYGESAVFYIVENNSAVTNALGTNKLLDLKMFGKQLGIDVIDMREEMGAVEKEGSNVSIDDVIHKMRTGTRTAEGALRRRIMVIDFNMLGQSLSKYKYKDFARAYTDTQVRLGDEIHRMATDTVMYVIGGASGDGGRLLSREEVTVLRNLEKVTVSVENDSAGFFGEGENRILRVRTKTGIQEIRVTDKPIETAETEAVVSFIEYQGLSPVTDASTRAKEIFREALGSEADKTKRIGDSEILSFLRGRLVSENRLDEHTAYIHDALVDGKREGQYRPIQRGVGIQGDQVIEDMAYLTGLNARRRELNYRGQGHIEFKEDIGGFQVLVTEQGISRYEFFERTGSALIDEAFKFLGFTATAAGYENFIELGTGREIMDAVTNDVVSTIARLDAVHLVGDGTGALGDAVMASVREAATAGLRVYRARGSKGAGTLEKRGLLITQDKALMNRYEGTLKEVGSYHDLFSKSWVVNEQGEAVRIRKVNRDGTLGAPIAGFEGVEVQFGEATADPVVVSNNGKKYTPLKRVIDGATKDHLVEPIVASWSEQNAKATADQKGGTGKDWQGKGTVWVADPRITTGEMIQNLERLGRTNGDGRWDVRREIYLQNGDLSGQFTLACEKFTEFNTLLTERVERKLSTKEVRDALVSFKTEVNRLISQGVTIRTAVEKTIEKWGESREGQDNLLRLTVEFNLLSRNTDTAKTVANETFFFHDLGRSMNQARDAVAGDAEASETVRLVEKAYRGVKQRNLDELKQGKDKKDAEAQIAAISESSILRSRQFLETLLNGGGVKINEGTPQEVTVGASQLTAGVRRIFEGQLSILKEMSQERFSSVVQQYRNVRPARKLNFANAARSETASERYMESRGLIYSRFRVEMSPETDGSRTATETVVSKASTSLRSKGMSAEAAAAAERRVNESDVYSYSKNGQRILTIAGEQYMAAIGVLVGLSDDDQKNVTAFLQHTKNGNGETLASLVRVQSGEKRMLQIADVLQENGFLDTRSGNASLLNTYVRFGAVMAADAELAAGKVFTREEMTTIMRAEIPVFGSVRDSMLQQEATKNLVAVIDNVQAQAPMLNFIHALQPAAGSLLAYQENQLQSEFDAATAYLNSAMSQSDSMLWLTKGSLPVQIAKIAAVGTLCTAAIAAGVVFSPVAGLAVAGVGFVGGTLGNQWLFSPKSKFVSTVARRQQMLDNALLPSGSRQQAMTAAAVLTTANGDTRKKANDLMNSIDAIGTGNAPALAQNTSLGQAMEMAGSARINTNTWTMKAEMKRGSSDTSAALQTQIEQTGQSVLFRNIPEPVQKYASYVKQFGPMALMAAASLSTLSLMLCVGAIVVATVLSHGYTAPAQPEGKGVTGTFGKMLNGGTKGWMSAVTPWMIWGVGVGLAVSGNPIALFPGLEATGISSFSALAAVSTQKIMDGKLSTVPGGSWLIAAWKKIPKNAPWKNEAVATRALNALKELKDDIEKDRTEALKTARVPEMKEKLEGLKKQLAKHEKKDEKVQAEGLKADIAKLEKNIARAEKKVEANLEGRTLKRLSEKLGGDKEAVRVALLLEGVSPERCADIQALGDKDKSALETRKLTDLKDKKRTIGFLVAIARFEKGLKGGQAITPGAIRDFLEENGDTQVTFDEAMEYYAGGELKEGESEDVETVSKQVEQFKEALGSKEPVVTGPNSHSNDIAPAVRAVRSGGIRGLFAKAVADARGEKDVLAKAASEMAESQKGIVDKMSERFTEAGVDAELVQKFTKSVGMRTQYNRTFSNHNVNEVLDKIAAAKPEVAPMVDQTKNDLTFSYYGEQSIARQALMSELTSEGDVKILSYVAGVKDPFHGAKWAERRPLHQAANMVYSQAGTIIVAGQQPNSLEVHEIRQTPDGGSTSEHVAFVGKTAENETTIFYARPKDQETVQRVVITHDDSQAIHGIDTVGVPPHVTVERYKGEQGKEEGEWVPVEQEGHALPLIGGDETRAFRFTTLEAPKEGDKPVTKPLGPIVLAPMHPGIPSAPVVEAEEARPAVADEAPAQQTAQQAPQAPVQQTAAPVTQTTSENAATVQQTVVAPTAQTSAETVSVTQTAPQNVPIDVIISGLRAQPDLRTQPMLSEDLRKVAAHSQVATVEKNVMELMQAGALHQVEDVTGADLAVQSNGAVFINNGQGSWVQMGLSEAADPATITPVTITAGPDMHLYQFGTTVTAAREPAPVAAEPASAEPVAAAAPQAKPGVLGWLKSKMFIASWIAPILYGASQFVNNSANAASSTIDQGAQVMSGLPYADGSVMVAAAFIMVGLAIKVAPSATRAVMYRLADRAPKVNNSHLQEPSAYKPVGTSGFVSQDVMDPQYRYDPKAKLETGTVLRVTESVLAGKSVTVYDPVRQLRSITLVNSPRQLPATVVAVLALLPVTQKNPVITGTDPYVAEEIDSLLHNANNPHHAEFAPIVRSIDVARLLRHPAIAAHVEQEFGISTAQLMTFTNLASVEASANGQFKDFVYHLISYNAEAMASSHSFAPNGAAVVAIADTVGGKIALAQSEGGRLTPIPSFSDFGNYAGFGRQLADIGIALYPYMITNESNQAALFVPGQITVLGQNGTRDNFTLKPYRPASYQTTQTPFASLLSRLFAAKLGLSPEDMEASLFDVGELPVARGAIDLAWKLMFNDDGSKRSWSPKQMAAAWYAIGELTAGRDNGQTNAYLRKAGFPQTDIDGLIKQIAAQLRGLKGMRQMASLGLMPVAGKVIEHHFADVAGMARSVVSARVAGDIGRSLQIAFVNGKEAKRRADALEAQLQQPLDREALAQSLMTLAGRRGKLSARDGRYYQMSEILDVFRGVNRNADAQAASLELLLNNFRREAQTVTGIAFPAEKLDNVDVRVLSKADFEKAHPTGEGAFNESMGAIDIMVDESADPQEAIYQAIGVLMHEVVHSPVDEILEGEAVSELGIATTRAEALVAHYTSLALTRLGLAPIANVIDLKTYRTIEDQENNGALYMLTGSRAKNVTADEVAAIKRRFGISVRVEVLAVNDGEYKAFRAKFGKAGINVVHAKHMTKVSKMESPLEIYAQEFLGTHRVHLVVDEKTQSAITSRNAKALGALGTVLVNGAGKWDAEIIASLLVLPANASLQNVIMKSIADRLTKRSA